MKPFHMRTALLCCTVATIGFLCLNMPIASTDTGMFASLLPHSLLSQDNLSAPPQESIGAGTVDTSQAESGIVSDHTGVQQPSDGKSSTSSGTSLGAVASVPPSVPLNLAASSVSQSSISLSWSASFGSDGIASYLIYQNSAPAATAAGTSCTVSGLSPGVTYAFTVRAKDTGGILSAPSAVLYIKTAVPAVSSSKIVSAYYANWAAYSGYTPLNIAARGLTHINYAFAAIGSDLRIALSDPAVDLSNLRQLNELKDSNPGLKTLISIGGWGGSGKFSDAALTDASRTVFADSVVSFIKQYGFDGVDIDWEYPIGGGLASNVSRPQDNHNFTLLLQKLREKLDIQGTADGIHYILTFAGGASSAYASGVELSLIKNYVDFASVMTYDLHGPWDIYADLNSPLYNPTENSPQYKCSADSAIRAWMSKGFPASKIIFGVPFYGYLYRGVSGANNGLYQPYSSATSISYDNIVSGYLGHAGVLRFYHPDAKVPWLFTGSAMITYDDEYSITQKAKYINANGLAGASIWELSQNKSGSLLSVLASNLR